MDAQKVTNLLLLCLGLFTAGVSLTLLVPFYPSEALAKVRSHDKHCNTINGVSDKFPTPCAFFHYCNSLSCFLFAQGVSVTQTGVVLSTVFVATIVFTPMFGKVTSDLHLLPPLSNL